MRVSIRGRSAFAVLASLVLTVGCNDQSAVLNTVPTTLSLQSLIPAQGALTDSVLVTLTGTNFVVGATTVDVSGGGVLVQRVNVAADGRSLSAMFFISGAATIGGRQVTVTVRGGSTSNAQTFTIVAGKRFIDLGLVIRDTKTNLLWEKKTPAGTGGLRDVSNTYSWCAVTGDAGLGTPCEGNTASWINDLNAANFAGFNNWHVPTAAQLQTILLTPCPGNGVLCIDPIFGPTATTTNSPYWSSSIVNAQNASFVSFTNGNVITDLKSAKHFVRAVFPLP